MNGQEILCMNCFAAPISDGDSHCHVCGWDNSRPQISCGLKYQTFLNGRYVVGRVKSINGEGLTYSAFDKLKKKMVEIKEFYPLSISKRNAEDNTIIPFEGQESLFEEYLDQFIELSKNISRLKEVTVVHSILDIFEENYTAYAVYEFVPSLSLKKHVQKNGVFSWNTAHNMFLPVLTALGLINSLGVTHLGISPETLRVTGERNLLITGFAIPAIRTALDDELSKEIFEGSSAIEQYAENTTCSETTDVYAFTASLLYAITGSLPNEAPKRLLDPKLLIPREYLKDLPPYVVTAIANALQVKPEDRTASFDRLKAEFSAAPTAIVTASSPAAIRSLPEKDSELPKSYRIPSYAWLIGSTVLTIIAIVLIAVVWIKKSPSRGDDTNTSSVAAVQMEAPNIINSDAAEIQTRIDNGDLKFKLHIQSRILNDTVEEGHIITQNPEPGEMIAEGDKIVITVSKGKEERTLPEIQGMSFTELHTNLTENGFEVLRKDEPSEDIQFGNVIRYEDANAGDKLKYGSTITLVVSAGPAEE
ncbi:PASTA domain-containing protein [Scatolibacter rhodanostii]|uniref:PASTA domain-containing protein n=1 Tax=Scatolibacter rhodanostii TaxID=2014781 RepID=UPI000C06A0FD|nr:PASTA domain-containing protein [Scatolibacter rhodanostii]